MADNDNLSVRSTVGSLLGTDIVPVWRDRGATTNSSNLKVTMEEIKSFVETGGGTGVVDGVVSASAAVVVDANKDITGFRNVTADKFIGQVTQLFDGGTDPTNAAYATARLTLTGEFVAGARATTKLSAAGQPADGETVTINTTVYRFKNATLAAYDVKIGADTATTLDNLKKAINESGIGDGTDYNTGTAFHPTMYATTNTDTTQVVVARNIGVTANSYPSTSTAGNLTWADTTVGGGTGDSDAGVASETITLGGTVYSFVNVLSETYASNWAVANEILFGLNSAAALGNLKVALNGSGTPGTEYSTGTVANTVLNATTIDATHLTFEADTIGIGGNSIAIAESLSNAAFDGAATFLAGGQIGTVGTAGEVRYSTSFLYICLAANTTAGQNWYKASLAAV